MLLIFFLLLISTFCLATTGETPGISVDEGVNADTITGLVVFGVVLLCIIAVLAFMFKRFPRSISYILYYATLRGPPEELEEPLTLNMTKRKGTSMTDA